MHQDIQNFSDLTVIDTSEFLEVRVTLRVHGEVKFEFSVNSDVFNTGTFSSRYPIDTLFTFRCNVSELSQGSAVEIVSVTVNDKKFLPIYLHLATPQTSYINFTGLWEFKIDRPFYPWYHDITGQGWIA